MIKDQNTLYIYDLPTNSYQKTFMKFKIEKIIGVYNDNLYYFTSQTNNPDKLEIRQLKIDQLKLTNFIKLYVNNSYLMIILFLLIVLKLSFNKE